MTDLDKKVEELVEEILDPFYDSESLESADWTPQWQHYIDTTEKAEEAIKSLIKEEVERHADEVIGKKVDKTVDKAIERIESDE